MDKMDRRKSARISKIVTDVKKEETKNQASSVLDATLNESVIKSEKENGAVNESVIKSSAPRTSHTRAPVGSLANNLEWNGIICELQQLTALDVTGLNKEQCLAWQQLLRKEKLDPLEKMQEAAFTEIINTRALEALRVQEDERMKEILHRKNMFQPDEKVFKYRQSTRNKNFLSEYVFPSVSHYPKGFNTKDTRGEQVDQQNRENMFIKPSSHLR